jgi:hypothetical protein
MNLHPLDSWNGITKDNKIINYNNEKSFSKANIDNHFINLFVEDVNGNKVYAHEETNFDLIKKVDYKVSMINLIQVIVLEQSIKFLKEKKVPDEIINKLNIYIDKVFYDIEYFTKMLDEKFTIEELKLYKNLILQSVKKIQFKKYVPVIIKLITIYQDYKTTKQITPHGINIIKEKL